MSDGGNILVKKATRKKLFDLGKKGETYDQIINKLIMYYESPTAKTERRQIENIRKKLYSS